jgi:predicted nucleic acid-binding protein
MIVDTDVLIWYFRGNHKAEKYLSNTEEISISAVTLMELIQGVKNKQELQTINKFLHANTIRVYYITEEINLHAIHLLEGYTLSDGIEWGDALIAATSLYHGETILTANTKHYTRLPNVDLKKFTPD